jgi:diguanylate cyclase (GGDEF)-like protein/PAS domain S-box-containing protein
MDQILSHPSEQLSLILDNIADGITAQTPEGRLLYANDAAAALCGYSTGKELLAAPVAEVMERFAVFDEHGRRLTTADLPGRIALRTGKICERVVRSQVLATGREYWSRIRSSPVIKNGRVILAINIFRDITQQHLAQQEQKRSARNQAFLVRSSEILTSSLDYETILKNIAALAVPEFAEWCTVDLAQPGERLKRIALTHANPKKVKRATEVSERYPEQPSETGGIHKVIATGQAEMVSEISEEMLAKSAKSPQHFELLKELELRSYMCAPIIVRDKVIGAITFLAGETERRFDQEDLKLAQELARRAALAIDNAKLYQEAQALAFHDTLTGLPNRKLLSDRLIQTIKQAHRNTEGLGILFMDLDRFKNINDTLGHSIGDDLLKETALRLTKCIRDEDTVARIGGDEFVILLNNTHSARDAIKVARKVLKAMSPVFTIDGRKLHVTTSIGIALYPSDGEDAPALLKHADTALYRAKEAGRNNYQLYDKTMGIETSEKLRLENELRLALDNNELIMYYQPIVDLRTGLISQVETLMRWEHPTLGLIYPNEFIPIAEETGMIVNMSGLIFRQVGRQLVKWQKMGLGQFRAAINLSGRQFMQPNMVDRIDAYLKEVGLAPEFVELEITESLAMKDIGITIQKLTQLRNLGISISVDDFGTGYSSLNYLKKLPIHSVKIDRSFVQNCIDDSQDAAIIQAIISLAHSLDLKVCAEGVETQEQKDFLNELGCDLMQGYLISRPLSPNDFTKFLRRYHKQQLF